MVNAARPRMTPSRGRIPETRYSRVDQPFNVWFGQPGSARQDFAVRDRNLTHNAVYQDRKPSARRIFFPLNDMEYPNAPGPGKRKA